MALSVVYLPGVDIPSSKEMGAFVGADLPHASFSLSPGVETKLVDYTVPNTDVGNPLWFDAGGQQSSDPVYCLVFNGTDTIWDLAKKFEKDVRILSSSFNLQHYSVSLPSKRPSGELPSSIYYDQCLTDEFLMTEMITYISADPGRKVLLLGALHITGKGRMLVYAGEGNGWVEVGQLNVEGDWTDPIGDITVHVSNSVNPSAPNNPHIHDFWVSRYYEKNPTLIIRRYTQQGWVVFTDYRFTKHLEIGIGQLPTDSEIEYVPATTARSVATSTTSRGVSFTNTVEASVSGVTMPTTFVCNLASLVNTAPFDVAGTMAEALDTSGYAYRVRDHFRVFLLCDANPVTYTFRRYCSTDWSDAIGGVGSKTATATRWTVPMISCIVGGTYVDEQFGFSFYAPDQFVVPDRMISKDIHIPAGYHWEYIWGLLPVQRYHNEGFIHRVSHDRDGNGAILFSTSKPTYTSAVDGVSLVDATFDTTSTSQGPADEGGLFPMDFVFDGSDPYFQAPISAGISMAFTIGFSVRKLPVPLETVT